MKQFLEKTFILSLWLGAAAVLLCLLSITPATPSKFFFMMVALFAGFLGFIFCCVHIVFSQRQQLRQPHIFMMLLSLLLNSIPLLYMIVMVTIHSKGN